MRARSAHEVRMVMMVWCRRHLVAAFSARLGGVPCASRCGFSDGLVMCSFRGFEGGYGCRDVLLCCEFLFCLTR